MSMIVGGDASHGRNAGYRPNRHARRALRYAGVVLGGVALSGVMIPPASAQLWQLEIAEWIAARFGYMAAGALAACVATGCGSRPAMAEPVPQAPPPGYTPRNRPARQRPAQRRDGRRLSITGDDSGQCYVAIAANGAEFSGLIDTGSSDLVFGRNDARKLGFNPASLSYDESYWSAHGVGHEASVTVGELSLDGVVVGRNVPAKIVETSMDHPLFGASVLKGIASFAYEQGNCTLTLNGNGGSATSYRDDGGQASIAPASSPETSIEPCRLTVPLGTQVYVPSLGGPFARRGAPGQIDGICWR